MSESSYSEETISLKSSPSVIDEIELSRKNSIIILNDYEETISLNSSPTVTDEIDLTRNNSIRMSERSYFGEIFSLNSSQKIIDDIELTRKNTIRKLLNKARKHGVSYIKDLFKLFFTVQ